MMFYQTQIYIIRLTLFRVTQLGGSVMESSDREFKEMVSELLSSPSSMRIRQ
jgi:hypothetical protein